MQRSFDIVFSFLALVVLAPILLPVIVILRLTGEGEVFYVQQRSGYKGNEFGLLKFATMLKDSPRIGAGEITVKDDPRVLPFGKLLRKTKLNELPQLWNIFIGDMSVVGPRPMVPNTYSHYSLGAREKLNTIRPGLTGIGSIVFRDEESLISLAAENENPHDFYKRVIAPYKGELEIWYHSHRSLFLDFQLIFMTAWAIVSPETRLYEKWFKDLPKRNF